MQRLLLSVVLLGFASPGWAALAFVQSAEDMNWTNGITTEDVAFDSSLTSGNMIVVFAISVQDQTYTISDTRGHTFVAHPSNPYRNAADNLTISMWWVLDVTAGADTVTVDFQSTADGQAFGIMVAEYSGQSTTASVTDAEGSSSGASMTTGSMSPGTAAIVVCGGGEAGFATAFTPGTNFTEREQHGSFHPGGALEDYITGGSGSFSCAMTSVDAGNWAMLGASFEEPSSGGPPMLSLMGVGQ